MVRSSHCDVLVVGAGVSGLTTAICLAEQGLRVVIRADRMPQQTTSAVAGAIWGPHLVEASERTSQWAAQTLTVFRELAAQPGTGVRIAAGAEAARQIPATGIPAELAGLGGFRACQAGELPPGFVAGWRYQAPLVHMPSYLAYLLARGQRAGVRIVAGTVASLAGAAREAAAAAVVNCTGAGAHRLVPDPGLVPVRGQVVVAANPGLTDFFIGRPDSASEPVYVFPHGDTVVLGGTEVAGDWSLAPDPAVAERILRDCAGAQPRLRNARVLAHRVGLRPARPQVRLAAVAAGPGAGGPLLVHNYGHGGAGITLSWGCAREAAALAAGNA